MFLPTLHFRTNIERKSIEISTVNAVGETKPTALMKLDTLTPGMAELITDALGMAYKMGAQNMAIALERPDLRVSEQKSATNGSVEDALRAVLMALAGAKVEKR